MLTQAQVRRLFAYDQATGVLTWRVKAGKNMRIGQHAGTATCGKDGRRMWRRVYVYGMGYMECKIIWLWMTGVWPVNQIDHKDLDPFNNSWGNLREATQSQNNANKASYGAHLKWVDERRGKFRARVQFKGIQYHVGDFTTEREAHDAAAIVSRKLHGAFHRPS